MANVPTYNQVVGLSIQLLSDGSHSIHAVNVVHAHGKLTIKSNAQYESIAALIKGEGTSKPYILTSYGQGVLDKKLADLVPGETNLGNKAIPGINLNEYYISEIAYDTTGWVSLAKKEKIDKLIRAIGDAGGFVVGVSIGYVSVARLGKILNFSDSLPINGKEVLFRDGEIDVIQPSDRPVISVVLEKEELPSDHLLAYGGVLNYYLGDHTSVDNNQLIKDQVQGYKYHRRTRSVMQLGLATIMLIALGNTYFFNEAYQKNESIKIGVQSQRPLLERVNTLKAQKEQLEKAAGPLQNNISKQAYYVDQLGSSLDGANILLTKVDVFPILSDRKKINSGLFEFDTELLVVKGKSKDPGRFGSWVSNLRNLDWVTSVEIAPFQQNEDGSNGFTVNIKIG